MCLPIELNISAHMINSTSCVKFLGVFIDDQLFLEEYKSEQCICVAHQANALRRFVKWLSLKSRITHYIYGLEGFYLLSFWYSMYFCGYTISLKREKVHRKSSSALLYDYLAPYHILIEKI